MKKFEQPKIAISMFEVENVITTSGTTTAAIDAAKAALGEANVAEANIFTFEF